MENASKALLIAGSVLIVILLIAMGVRVFNSTQGTTEQVEGTMQSTEVAMFNNKFLPYIGNNKSKTDVMSLANNIIASNSTNNVKIELSYKIKIKTVTYTWAGTDTIAQQACMQRISECDASSKFKITVQSYNANGYIEKIYITNL